MADDNNDSSNDNLDPTCCRMKVLTQMSTRMNTQLVRRCGEQNSTSTRDYGLRSTDQINNDSNTHDI